MTFKILFFPLFSLSVLAQASVSPTPTIFIQRVQLGQIERCIPASRDFVPLKFGTVSFKHPDTPVAMIQKKDEQITPKVATDLKNVFTDSLKNTLQKCGYAFSTSESEPIVVNVIVDDYYAHVKNRIVVGEDKAILSLVLELKRGGDFASQTIDITIEKSLKGLPFGKAKRLEKTLNAILADVMNEVAMSTRFFDAVKELSKMQIPEQN